MRPNVRQHIRQTCKYVDPLTDDLGDGAAGRGLVIAPGIIDRRPPNDPGAER